MVNDTEVKNVILVAIIRHVALVNDPAVAVCYDAAVVIVNDAAVAVENANVAALRVVNDDAVIGVSAVAVANGVWLQMVLQLQMF